jgi:anti-sigma B factor antagonist
MKQIDKLFLRTENKEGKCIVYVGGELDLESAAQMRAAMSPLVELADRELTLNLRELRYVDSTGIGILVTPFLLKQAEQA